MNHPPFPCISTVSPELPEIKRAKGADRFFSILRDEPLCETKLEDWMKPVSIVGLLLIVVGIIGFCLGGLSFTHEKQDAKIGPVEIDHTQTNTVPIPPILSGIALVGGIGLMVVGAKS
jgi:hypothetical protein